jgi:glycosyltransferase involved in cell wall biosynthesis
MEGANVVAAEGGPGMRLQGIKYVSVHEPSGYGNAARRYLLGLKRSGIPVTWTPMVPGRWRGLYYMPFEGKSVGDPELDPLCNAAIDYDVVVFHTVPEYYPMLAERESGKPAVGYTVWETDRIPRHWLSLLRGMDHLLVPCHWNKVVFQSCGVDTPIDVVPHISAVGRPAFRSDFPPVPERDYVFYTIGMWTARKALWNTITCFLDTFRATDPVRLIVKTSKMDFTRPRPWRFPRSAARSARRITRRHRHAAAVDLIDDDLSEECIRALHARGDCYVSLTRSEGWGLGAFDAAAAGNPVMMTGYGGQLDFLPREAAYLVDYTLVPVIDKMGEPSYTNDQKWAEPDLSKASRLMREAAADRQAGAARGNALQSFVVAHFNERDITKRLLGVLENVRRRDGG